MKTSLLLAILASSFLFGTGGCTEEEPAKSVSFRIVIQDENGTEKEIFTQGTDINLGLAIVNNSGQTIEFDYDGFRDQVINEEDFLFVYGESEEGDAAVGRPHQIPLYYRHMNLPPIEVPVGEMVFINYPWSLNPENVPIPAGKYHTAFNKVVTVDDRQVELELYASFEVK